jgi:hypothetical protein
MTGRRREGCKVSWQLASKRQLAIGSWQLARKEEIRSEKDEKRRKGMQH